jgi:hypothetical protein
VACGDGGVGWGDLDDRFMEGRWGWMVCCAALVYVLCMSEEALVPLSCVVRVSLASE